MVRTFDLKKYFTDSKLGTKKAVDGITFEARPGSIFGLLGVNGAGKTTTLRMLSTVIKPTSGRAEVAGYDVVENPEKVRASIGFMSSSTALYGRLTAREVLQYFGGLYGLEGAALRQRMEYVIGELQLQEFADRLCDKLSTGQKQRVTIARTILHDPPVLFFDEPTAGLDAVMAESVLEFIRDARDKGKTIVFSTHIMSEVEEICDHIVVIDEGVVKAEGTVDSIMAQTGQPTFKKAYLSIVDYRNRLEQVPA